MKKEDRINILYVLILFISSALYAQNIFVSTIGNDGNSGTINQPLQTITSAIIKIKSGDTIYVRSGIYFLNTTISISKNGTESSRYYLFAFPGERPVLDFSSVSIGTKGILLSADYWYIKGINITKAGHNGIGITGSNNIVEFCSLYENRNSGMQLDNGASNNRIINCDSYYNYDEHKQGADADGFAPKLTVGTGNYFYGCRAWSNSDDGWDGYMRGATDVTTTLENCWTFNNGYTKDGFDPGPQANGNGFKMGGGDNSNSEHLMHHFILKNCLAFDNKVKGFDQNNNDGSMTLLNCTSYNNKTANYRITRQVNAGQTVKVENCVSFEGKAEFGNFVTQRTNSWQSPFVVTSNDFITVDTIGVRGKRKPDGSLPNINFMHLSAGSDLIDAGTNVGLTYTGIAPDLGAFEYDVTNSSNEIVENIPSVFSLSQNYPNPFNPSTNIDYSLPKEAKVRLDVFDILGRMVATIVDETKLPGRYTVKFDASKLASGIYIYRLIISEQTFTRKMLFVK